MSLLTCKDFLKELNDYLDDATSPGLRQEIEAHLAECPNCWVICDTTRRTLRIYKGTDLYPLPSEVHQRLMEALRRKMSQSKNGSGQSRSGS